MRREDCESRRWPKTRDDDWRPSARTRAKDDHGASDQLCEGSSKARIPLGVQSEFGSSSNKPPNPFLAAIQACGSRIPKQSKRTAPDQMREPPYLRVLNESC